MKIEDVLNETTFNWPFPPITQIPGSDGITRSGVSLTSVDPMPFWLYGAVLSPLSEPKTPMLRLLVRMQIEPMPEDEKLNYTERNLLNQALDDGLVELTDAGYQLMDRGKKYLDSFSDVVGQLANTMPHFYLTPAPLLSF